MAFENKEIFTTLISSPKINFDQSNMLKESLLIILLKMNSKFYKNISFKMECMEELIKRGANVNVVDRKGKPALIYAIEEEKEEKGHAYRMVEILLNNAADPNILENCNLIDETEKEYYREITITIFFEHFNLFQEILVEILIEPPLDLPNDKTPLFYAIQLNSFPLVKLLIEKGADPMQKVSHFFFGEKNSLITAAMHGRFKIFKYLYKTYYKNSTYIQNVNNKIQIIICCFQSKETEIFEYLLDKKYKTGKEELQELLLKFILISKKVEFIQCLSN